MIQDESPNTFKKIYRILKTIGPDLGEFSKQGPISYGIKEQQFIVLNNNLPISFDVVQPKLVAARGPMVVIAHGNRSYKEAHRYQAVHLASYGFSVFLPQLPTTEQWDTNGLILKEFVKGISESAEMRATQNQMKPILVGHSFGGSAVTMAAYLGTPISGLVLLDPAVFNENVGKLMWDVQSPAILLGADPEIYLARKRRLFRKHYGGDFAELTIKGATHNDAQYPTMFALNFYGLDPVVQEKNQKLFTALLTASAFSLTLGDSHDFVRSLAKRLKKQGLIRDFYQRSSR